MQVLYQMQNPQMELTLMNMYNKFIQRIRINLHLVLASPISVQLVMLFATVFACFHPSSIAAPSTGSTQVICYGCYTIGWFQASHFLWMLQY